MGKRDGRQKGPQQHDEPDKNAEKTRLSRKIERDDLERTDFQVPGGATRHPAMPED